MSGQPDGDLDLHGAVPPQRPRRGALALGMAGGVGAVLLALFALSGSTVAADGTLVEPFALLALGTLTLTGVGLVGLGLLFRDVRRRSTCGRGGC
jgi:hypothetical protein